MIKCTASLKAYASSIMRWLYNYSSVRFIVEKAFPSNNPVPPNAFLIGLISIYIATYTLATGLHESRRHSLERRVSSLSIQLQSEHKKAALKKIAILQNTKIHPRPRFVNFRSLNDFLSSAWSPLKTILTEDIDKEIVQDLKELVETYKSHLEGADLSNANLSSTNLSNAKINGTLFINADLSNADLSNVIGQKANFAAANLRNTDLSGSTLYGSIFDLADISGARFTFSSLRDVSFYNATTNSSSDWVGTDFSDSGIVNVNSEDPYYLEGCFSEIFGEGSALTSNGILYSGCYMPIFNIRLDRSHIDLDLYRNEVRRLVELLNAWPELPILIKGHTDEIGTNEYKLALGERLASSLAEYLVSKGISRMRIRTISYGEERAVDMSKSPSRHLKNNRIEVGFLPPNK